VRKRFNDKEYDLVFSTQERKGLLLMAIRRLDVAYTAKRRKRFINKDLIRRNTLSTDLQRFDLGITMLMKGFKKKQREREKEFSIN